MRGLLGRMIASYIALALITLAGAGVLVDRLLASRLVGVDEADAQTRVNGAARLAVLMMMQEPDRSPDTIESDIRQTNPRVKLTVRPVFTASEGRPVWVHVQTALATTSDGQQTISMVTGHVYELPGQPRERVVQIEVKDGARTALGVSYLDNSSMRIELLRRSLLGAGSLALAAAFALAVWLGRTLTAPLNRMAEAAGHLADGHWDVPLPRSGPREIRQLSEAFQSMAARLAGDFQMLRSDREKLQHLTAEMAHELKTPIASLRTYHELLLDGEQENPRTRQELLERGAAQVARLEYLTNGLVDMAKLESHVAALNLEEGDLVDLAGQAVGAVRPSAEQRGLTVVIERPEEDVPVLADPHRVGQALDNLLQNAMRCSPDGGQIMVRVAAAEGRAHVEVLDEGPGIDEAILPRLFHPFVRGEGSRGLGLGLAVVKAVAQSHGGDVSAENRESGGARFVFSIPLQGVRG